MDPERGAYTRMADEGQQPAPRAQLVKDYYSSLVSSSIEVPQACAVGWCPAMDLPMLSFHGVTITVMHAAFQFRTN